MIETIGTKVFGVSLQPKTLYDGFQNQHIENAENAGGKLEAVTNQTQNVDSVFFYKEHINMKCTNNI